MPHPDPPTEPTSAEGSAAAAEQRLAEVAKAYRALQADNEGYRERMARNAERRYAQRHEGLLLKFIDILDNLDRALAAAETNPAGASLIEGLILVRTQLLQTLQEEGLERIPVVGIPYDPEVAEAVGTEPVQDPDHHHVVLRDIRRGYRLNGRLARAAQVIVGEFAGERPAPTPAVREQSDRIEVVQDSENAEDTGSIAALAEEAAAAVGSSGDAEERTGEHGVISDGDSLEDAAREAAAMAGDDDGDVATLEAGTDDDDSLEAAAREAAAMAEGDDVAESEPELDVEPAEGDAGDLISDAESLEDAAREAAALWGDEEPAGGEGEEAAAPEILEETGEEEPAGESELSAVAPEPVPEAGAAAARPRVPAHPLDDVDPEAFDDIPAPDAEDDEPAD